MILMNTVGGSDISTCLLIQLSYINKQKSDDYSVFLPTIKAYP